MRNTWWRWPPLRIQPRTTRSITGWPIWTVREGMQHRAAATQINTIPMPAFTACPSPSTIKVDHRESRLRCRQMWAFWFRIRLNHWNVKNFIMFCFKYEKDVEEFLRKTSSGSAARSGKEKSSSSSAKKSSSSSAKKSSSKSDKAAARSEKRKEKEKSSSSSRRKHHRKNRSRSASSRGSSGSRSDRKKWEWPIACFFFVIVVVVVVISVFG